MLGLRICKAAVCAVSFWGPAYLFVNGLQTGVMVNFFRAFLTGDTDNLSVVHRTAHPVLFWTYEGLFLLVVCASLPLLLASIVQFNPLRRIWRRLFIARRKKARMRSVEAGQGPDPF